MLRRFDLVAPATLAEACQILANTEEARPLAGGTALAVLIKQRVFLPRVLVNLKALAGLSYITHQSGAGLRIGALTSQHDLEASALLADRYPALRRAASQVANIRIRVMSTVGGSLCEADHQSDLSPMMTALGATLTVQGPDAERQVPLAEFYTGPYETVLQPGELVREVQVPELPAGSRGTYLKFVTGPASDRPCLGVAAVAQLDSAGRCQDVRLVLGGIAGVPWRVREAEALLVGERLSATAIAAAAQRAYQLADPLDEPRASAWYKKEMVRVCVGRALAELGAANGKAGLAG